MSSLRRRRRPIGEINVVPYIDVMLVLLIIFMVTAPLLTQGVEVDLPEAKAEPVDAATFAERPPVVISIDRAGQWFLNSGDTPEAPIDASLLEARISALQRRTPDFKVFIKGDRAVPYGRVVETMVLLQRVGVRQVGFLTDPLVEADEAPQVVR